MLTEGGDDNAVGGKLSCCCDGGFVNADCGLDNKVIIPGCVENV